MGLVRQIGQEAADLLPDASPAPGLPCPLSLPAAGFIVSIQFQFGALQPVEINGIAFPAQHIDHFGDRQSNHIGV